MTGSGSNGNGNGARPLAALLLATLLLPGCQWVGDAPAPPAAPDPPARPSSGDDRPGAGAATAETPAAAMPAAESPAPLSRSGRRHVIPGLPAPPDRGAVPRSVRPASRTPGQPTGLRWLPRQTSREQTVQTLAADSLGDVLVHGPAPLESLLRCYGYTRRMIGHPARPDWLPRTARTDSDLRQIRRMIDGLLRNTGRPSASSLLRALQDQGAAAVDFVLDRSRPSESVRPRIVNALRTCHDLIRWIDRNGHTLYRFGPADPALWQRRMAAAGVRGGRDAAPDDPALAAAVERKRQHLVRLLSDALMPTRGRLARVQVGITARQVTVTADIDLPDPGADAARELAARACPSAAAIRTLCAEPPVPLDLTLVIAGPGGWGGTLDAIRQAPTGGLTVHRTTHRDSFMCIIQSAAGRREMQSRLDTPAQRRDAAQFLCPDAGAGGF